MEFTFKIILLIGFNLFGGLYGMDIRQKIRNMHRKYYFILRKIGVFFSNTFSVNICEISNVLTNCERTFIKQF